jgi:hypothetical protein
MRQQVSEKMKTEKLEEKMKQILEKSKISIEENFNIKAPTKENS